MKLRAISKLHMGAAIFAAATALALAACGGGGGSGLAPNNCPRSLLSYGGGGGGGSSSGSNCPAPTPTPTPGAAAQAVGVLLTGENPVTVAPYAPVLGFFNGTNGHAPNGSGVVHLTASQSVQFTNIEAGGGQPHTASFIAAGTTFPASPSIPSAQSPAGTSIQTAGFSSGNLNPGQVSSVYTSGGPAMFVFGCAYHYASNHMRTIIIVM